MTTLIVIRGNSGSGKTTLAHLLHNQLTESLLLSQDVIRRDMLQVDDKPGNLAISLMTEILKFGQQQEKFVILEGILGASVYGQMLSDQLQLFDKTIVIYYQLTLAETIRRHHMKSTTNFTTKDLQKWYQKDDRLALSGELIFDESVSLEMAEQQILAKIK
ncbi:hypothetical protein GCM10025879_06110 [Leuconostoc litchii]|uniref:Kinase n=1 Tax=Leuconostoc litchii TaxID=1981069 RepID=A0A6P2CN48_9LACO|nr:AAA family ATPase [Leuconostoc litchii]TYC47360.1 hypothetical protein ESZ47_04260 [Leuconostoc litchii]GMA69365.1 hypothetical protein GCM10025879_06110 [Leuconostoc litchii]